MSGKYIYIRQAARHYHHQSAEFKNATYTGIFATKEEILNI
jgi:hypothetical protein